MIVADIMMVEDTRGRIRHQQQNNETDNLLVDHSHCSTADIDRSDEILIEKDSDETIPSEVVGTTTRTVSDHRRRQDTHRR